MWDRWKKLNRDDRRALLPAAWRLVVVRLALALRGVHATQRGLARRTPASSGVLTDPGPWHCRAMALARVSQRLPATRCLARSLTLWWWMRGSGLDPKWHIGVRPGTVRIHGHAWVECDGFLFDETAAGAATYARLDTPAVD